MVAKGRDLGASAFASRDAPRSRTLLLGGQAGLTLRLTRPAVVAWVCVLAVIGLVFGLVAQAAGSALQGSPGLDRVIERLGGSSAGAASYLGFVFVVAAGLVAIAVAGQIAAIRNEEAAGHLDNLLVRPVARARWLVVRLGVGVGLVVGGSVLVGIAAWVGATTQHAGIAFGDLAQAGLNVAPRPSSCSGSARSPTACGPVERSGSRTAWSSGRSSSRRSPPSSTRTTGCATRRRSSTSPRHRRPTPDWTAAAWLVGLGLLAAVVGVATFGTARPGRRLINDVCALRSPRAEL